MSILMRNLVEYHGINEFLPTFSDSYKTVNIQGTKYIPNGYSLIESICKFISTPLILSIDTKSTPISSSTTGQVLSGYKVNFHGNMKNILEYSSVSDLSCINIFEFTHDFNEYIILPKSFLSNSNPNIISYIHDLNIIKISHDKFFYSICVTFNAEF